MTGHDANAGLRRVLEALTAPEPTVPEPVTPAATELPEAVPMPEHFDIEEALRNGWLEMWYQPKIDLRQKCLAGAEALARIRHPDYGVLLPASFVAGVGDDKLVPLTEHALRTTLRDWEVFDASGFNLRLAINLPVNHLLKLPISEIVDEHRPTAEHWPGLIVEVTEDQIVREIKRAQEIASILKVSGITVSIDDFGAGYSSFHSLRELAFTELKLNYSFVKNCAVDATNAAICQTAIDLAHRFGSAAVAEGIESIADLQALQIMGCDFGQGILLAAPMPLSQFMALLQQRMNRPRPAPSQDEASTVAA
jgi:EAL domain-containing protein (putative c-di-GMP-specific phosphodiesterase class I)